MNLCKPSPMIISYPGSRWRISRQLAACYPSHKTFVSVFGGAGSEILTHPGGAALVYNDIDSHLANLFAVLRDRPDELVEAARYTLYSRECFEAAWRIIREHEKCPVKRAWAYLVIHTLGRFEDRQRMRLCRERISGPIHLPNLDLYVQLAARRFRRCIVENLHWKDLLPAWDDPCTLFSVDPPFLNASPKLYPYGMTRDEHRDLLTAVRKLTGKVILYGYPDALYDELLPDWKSYYWDHHLTIACQINPRTVREQIWTNFPFHFSSSN